MPSKAQARRNRKIRNRAAREAETKRLAAEAKVRTKGWAATIRTWDETEARAERERRRHETNFTNAGITRPDDLDESHHYGRGDVAAVKRAKGDTLPPATLANARLWGAMMRNRRCPKRPDAVLVNGRCPTEGWVRHWWW